VALTASALVTRLCGRRPTAPPEAGGLEAALEIRRERRSVAADGERPSIRSYRPLFARLQAVPGSVPVVQHFEF
jgi:hypothetical protein